MYAALVAFLMLLSITLVPGRPLPHAQDTPLLPADIVFVSASDAHYISVQANTNVDDVGMNP